MCYHLVFNQRRVDTATIIIHQTGLDQKQTRWSQTIFPWADERCGAVMNVPAQPALLGPLPSSVLINGFNYIHHLTVLTILTTLLISILYPSLQSDSPDLWRCGDTVGVAWWYQPTTWGEMSSKHNTGCPININLTHINCKAPIGCQNRPWGQWRWWRSGWC